MNSGVIETLELPKFSIGVGDRFAHQAKAQLAACMKAAELGSRWSRYGTSRTASTPSSAPSRFRRATAADAAVKEIGWSKPYFLDADHINLKTVQRFLDPCDFFTLDVADMIGQPAKAEDVAAFLAAHAELMGR